MATGSMAARSASMIRICLSLEARMCRLPVLGREVLCGPGEGPDDSKEIARRGLTATAGRTKGVEDSGVGSSQEPVPMDGAILLQ